jgi:hypothetical protein
MGPYFWFVIVKWINLELGMLHDCVTDRVTRASTG